MVHNEKTIGNKEESLNSMAEKCVGKTEAFLVDKKKAEDEIIDIISELMKKHKSIFKWGYPVVKHHDSDGNNESVALIFGRDKHGNHKLFINEIIGLGAFDPMPNYVK